MEPLDFNQILNARDAWESPETNLYVCLDIIKTKKL